MTSVARVERVAQLLLAFALSLVLGAGCRGCQDDGPLAKLTESKGSVDRDFASELAKWQNAAVGAEFDVGDGIRTGKASSATLALDDGSLLGLEAETLIRFLETPPDSKERGLDVEMGQASLQVSDTPLVLRTSFGLARIEPGSRVSVRKGDQGFYYEVSIGTAELESNSGEVTALSAGQGIEIGVAEVARRYDLGKGPPLAASAEPEKVPDTQQPKEEETGDVRVQVTGRGARLQGEGGEWKRLEPGASTLQSGSTLQIARGTTVEVSRGQHRATLRGSGTYVVGAPSSFVQANGGSMSLSSASGVSVAVPGGSIVVAPGGSAEVTSAGKQGTRVRVNTKRITLAGKSERQTLEAGQEGLLGPDGELSVAGRGLDHSDVSIRAGESAVIHDPSPPTAVRFLFDGACATGGVIELSGGAFARGDGSVALSVPTGKHGYTLKCLGEDGIREQAASSGSVTVLKDAGTRPVPTSAPETTVNADGRSYTVLYQNQLPSISVSWANAPQAGTFTLFHNGRSIKTSAPYYAFKSGTLQEGRHTLHFQGGGKVSRQTSVTIRFDNAAPMASLSTPPNPSAQAGERITIAGTALPGWSVSVDGKELGQDNQRRFSGQVAVPDGERAVAVRLTHPKRGTHIYLRRLVGTK